MRRFPWISQELAEKMAKACACPLTHAQQARAMRLHAKGVSQTDMARLMKVSSISITYTRQVYSDFAIQWKLVKDSRKAQVESHLYRYMLGEVKEVKTYWEAKRDHEGKLVKDTVGKQIWLPIKKEIKHLPPNTELIKFYLQTHDEAYRPNKAGEQSDTLMPSESLRQKVDEIRKAAGLTILEGKQRKAM
jgi:hypothetical protein